MSKEQVLEPHYALEATQLSAILGGQTVLEIPSLQVHPNEVLAIIGPNGSGKTTLLLCLALLLKPATGTISYHGLPVHDGSSVLRIRRKLAVVFQEPLLLDTTVWENVVVGLRLRGVHWEERNARAEKWLERFGIAELAKRQAWTISGGEAQRASLARALALEPEVLFLDEPFAALDPPTRQALIEDFQSVLGETKVTTVMVTHDRDEALTLGDRVAVLMNGHIRQIGLPGEIFSSPVDEEVASFVGVENVLPAVITAQDHGLATVTVEKQHLDAVSELPAGSKVTVCLHPEDVTLSVPSPETVPSSARNHLMGKVNKIFPVGSQVRATVDCGFPLVTLITRRSSEDLRLQVDQAIVASFKASSIHLIPKY